MSMFNRLFSCAGCSEKDEQLARLQERPQLARAGLAVMQRKADRLNKDRPEIWSAYFSKGK